MSGALIPCPACSRHVFVEACACPFCAVKLRVCEARVGAAPGPHLSRAARLAAGAALVGAAACSSTSVIPPYGIPPGHDASADVHADGDAGGADAGSAGAGGSASGGAGGTSSPPDAGPDRPVVPIYGAAAPVQKKPVP